ncbi:MAG: hypothetical protein H0V40_06755 [Actinobacteria bacterium]|nr:hypothetical protein [Actinomycetota bacterium]
MPQAVAAVGTILLLALAGCGGSDELPPQAARDEADAFVRALVADGDLGAASAHAAPGMERRLPIWHAYLLRDGIQTVEGPGGSRANCQKAFPVFSGPGGRNCIVYRLVGLKPWRSEGKTLVTTARFRVWLRRRDGGWKVSDFDYTPRLEER